MVFKYQFIRLDPELGMLVDMIDPAKGADVLAAAELRGWSYERPFSRPACREELQGQPVFRELNGPMWGGISDGACVIRYECPAAYARCSA